MHETESLRDLAVAALEELKALDVIVLDVRGKVSWTDFMVVASGNSDRHVRALARNVVTRADEAGQPPLGVEGDQEGEWVLIDLADVVVHVMLPRVRDFYQLERLWTVPPGREATTG